MSKATIAVVGGGATGRTLGRLLRKAGYPIAGVACRSMASVRRAARFIGAGRATDDARTIAREADVVLLTVPDDAIAAVARRLSLAGALRRGATVIHCCGNYPHTILRTARVRATRVRGVHTAAIHPLKSFANPRRAAESFAGTFCAYDGDRAGCVVARRLIGDIGGIGIAVPASKKVLYHAAAVFASNYVAAVVGEALKLFRRCGILDRVAYRALLTLARGTLTNIEAVGLPAALTGPIERGDLRTVESHCRALARAGSGSRNLYASLGIAAVDLAVAKGRIDPRRAAALRRMLKRGS